MTGGPISTIPAGESSFHVTLGEERACLVHVRPG
jgi:hypothetical protein